MLDEFGCTIVYILGKQNDIADLLSRFSTADYDEKEEIEEINYLRKVYEESIVLPINLPTITQHQQNSNENISNTTTKIFGTYNLLITVNANKIIIPSTLEQDLTEWYHENLKYPGGDRMYLTIKEIFYWKGIKDYIKNYIKT